MTNSSLDSFLEKWRSRWPEWQVAEAFVPVAQRELAVAWFALLQEFEDAMNIEGETLPADAKLAWWGEELRDWARQRSRHPLGRVLEPHRDAPWFALGEALPVLQRLRETEGGAALETARPLAQAIADVERVLFGAQVDADVIASCLLASRYAMPLPGKVIGAAPRRVLVALQRLRTQTPGKAPSLPRVLWRSWRAASA